MIKKGQSYPLYKNTSRYIFLSLLIAAVCSLLTYSVFYNPFQLNYLFTICIIQAVIYLLLGWDLFTIGLAEKNTHLLILAFLIPAISLLSLSGDEFYKVFNDRNIQKVACYTAFLLFLCWILLILISRIKTLFGLLFIINILITLFIYLPYGIPRTTVWEDGQIKFDFKCFPFYSLNSYRPFTHKKEGFISLLSDVRAITSMIFIIYEIIHSLLPVGKFKNDDSWSENIPEIENPILQFIQAGAYFVWKVIQRFLFFSKLFFKELWYNVIEQLKKSTQSYIYAIILALAFLVPLAVRRLSLNIYMHIKNPQVPFPDVYQLWMILFIIILFFTPLLMLIILSADEDHDPHFIWVKAGRPKFYVPIYITFFSLGITVIFSFFLEHIINYFLFIFLMAIICSTIWGILKAKKS